MLTYSPKKTKVLAIPEPTSPEKRFQQQRMHDALILLENLAMQEEATIKLILDCLYDVGSINLINKKIAYGPANKLIKRIASMSKPVFRIIAWRWFKKNCPRLIANWLYRQVSFK
jgi:hypothetical protein